MTARINQFLAFARPSEPKPERFDLAQLVAELADLLEPDLDAKQLTLSGLAAGSVVFADREMIRQALFNLLQNAIQAAGEGGSVETSIVCGRDGRRRIEVADRGPGVPNEIVETLFTPYFTTRAGGTGLGLAIVPPDRCRSPLGGRLHTAPGRWCHFLVGWNPWLTSRDHDIGGGRRGDTATVAGRVRGITRVPCRRGPLSGSGPGIDPQPRPRHGSTGCAVARHERYRSPGRNPQDRWTTARAAHHGPCRPPSGSGRSEERRDDYLAKPVDLDELEAAIADAIGPVETTLGDKSLPELPPWLICESREADRPRPRNRRGVVAPSNAPVLILGESGTGKEVVAQYDPPMEPRRARPARRSRTPPACRSR